jgi:hypothetical protein
MVPMLRFSLWLAAVRVHSDISFGFAATVVPASSEMEKTRSHIQIPIRMIYPVIRANGMEAKN